MMCALSHAGDGCIIDSAYEVRLRSCGDELWNHVPQVTLGCTVLRGTSLPMPLPWELKWTSSYGNYSIVISHIIILLLNTSYDFSQCDHCYYGKCLSMSTHWKVSHLGSLGRVPKDPREILQGLCPFRIQRKVGFWERGKEFKYSRLLSLEGRCQGQRVFNLSWGLPNKLMK